MRNAGDEGRELFGLRLREDMRDWKRRSKGRKDGVGELKPAREVMEEGMLLPREETPEPYKAEKGLA
jgi:hypothetical protein